MENLVRKKKYKAVSADVTINRIRTILFENGITIKETYHNTGIESLKSCSIEVINEDIDPLRLSTNGKGMLFEYSLASALAEFLERLQNDLITKSRGLILPNTDNISFFENNKLLNSLKQEGLINDFIYSPDEVFLSKNEIVDKLGSLLNKMLNLNVNQDLKTTIDEIGIFDNKKAACLPFYNLNKKKVEVLPIELIRRLCGSNGMAAGNNNKEAFIQGLCEIFERYAIRKIYLDQVELPDIPNDYFIGEKIYDIIKDIEKNRKFTIIIKDCSCGMGLPVIGLLLIDKIGQRYTFHLGSDPSPISALERCLTEINQGNTFSFNSKLKDIKDNSCYFNTNSDENSKEEIILKELKATMKDGTGYWPNYIFDENNTFNGFLNSESNSDEEDIRNLLNIVFNNNFEIFVRDVSVFGFPSLQIVIPGMSEMTTNHKFLMKNKLQLKTLFNLKEASEEEIGKLALTLKDQQDKQDHSLKTYYSYVKDENISGLTFELFLAMLFYRVSDFKNALLSINEHIIEVEKFDKAKDLYIYCARDFISQRLQTSEIKVIKRHLVKFHDNGLVDEIIKDFSHPEDIFNYFNFPVCFDCDKCKLTDKCKYLNIVRFLSKLSNKKKNSKIDQNELLEILN